MPQPIAQSQMMGTASLYHWHWWHKLRRPSYQLKNSSSWRRPRRSHLDQAWTDTRKPNPHRHPAV